MSFSEIFGRAWRNTWKGGYWGFIITWYLAAFVVVAILGVVLVLIAGLDGMSTLSAPSFSSISRSVLVAFGVVTGLGFALFIPLGVFYQAGIVHLSNELAEGRNARLGDGWASGIRNFAPVLLVTLAVVGIGIVTFIILAMPFGLIIGMRGLTLGSIENAGPDLIIQLCCCGGIFYLVWIGVALIIQSWNELALRHVVISGQGAGEALGEAFADVRTRFRRTILLALALLGISFAVSIATSMFSAPFDALANSGSGGVAAFGDFISFLLSLVSLFFSSAIALFGGVAWTLYYRSYMFPTPAEPVGYYPAPYDGGLLPAPPAPPAPPVYAPVEPPVVDTVPPASAPAPAPEASAPVPPAEPLPDDFWVPAPAAPPAPPVAPPAAPEPPTPAADE